MFTQTIFFFLFHTSGSLCMSMVWRQRWPCFVRSADIYQYDVVDAKRRRVFKPNLYTKQNVRPFGVYQNRNGATFQIDHKPHIIVIIWLNGPNGSIFFFKLHDNKIAPLNLLANSAYIWHDSTLLIRPTIIIILFVYNLFLYFASFRHIFFSWLFVCT